MTPLYIVDMQCTIFHSGTFEQGTSKLTPRYLFRCLTVNTAVKYCQCVDEDFLGYWIYTDLWVNNAFSFWSLKARIAPVPLVPFQANRALLSRTAHWSNISFYPRDSTRPLVAHVAFNSLGSLAPLTSTWSRNSFRSQRSPGGRVSQWLLFLPCIRDIRGHHGPLGDLGDPGDPGVPLGKSCLCCYMLD